MTKKKIAGALIITGIVAATVIAISPMLLYGPIVTASETTVQFDLSSSGSGSISISEPGSFTADVVGVTSSEKAISAHEYVFSKIGGLASVSEGANPGMADNVVSIYISVTLETPTGKELQFSFNPRDLQGTGLKNVTILMGPDELNNEAGEFQITINITVKVTAPFVGEVANINLTPVQTSFTVGE